MLLGALFQTALALIPSPWLRFGPESAAISTVYQTLADFALNPEDLSTARQLNNSLVKVEGIVSDSPPQSRKGRVLRSLFAHAEHIRMELIVLAQVRQCLLTPDQQEHNDLEETLQAQMQAISDILSGIAERCKRVLIVPDSSASYQQIDAAIARLRTQEYFLCESTTPRQVAIYYMALRKHLHHAEEEAMHWQHTRRRVSLLWEMPPQPRFQLHDPLNTLRSNLTLRSTACRHAIRLAIVLVLATALYRFSPLTRGYWVPLTALFVLKPDFRTTFVNSSTRSIGTILGAVLTSVVVVLLHPASDLLAVLVSLMAFFAFSFLNVNYALFSLFITAETVLLLTFVDPQPAVVVLYRAIDTTLGAAFALLAYSLWPTWERSRVHENMAARMEALQKYFIAVMDAFIDSAHWNPDLITQRRLAARLARSNAEASVERALNEPVQYRGDADALHGLLVAMDSVAKGILAIEALLLDEKGHKPRPELEKFKEEVCTALEKLSVAIRHTDLFDVPAKITLRSLEQYKKAAEARGDDVTDLNMLILQSGRIVNGINVMNRLLSVHSGTHRPRPCCYRQVRARDFSPSHKKLLFLNQVCRNNIKFHCTGNRADLWVRADNRDLLFQLTGVIFQQFPGDVPFQIGPFEKNK